MCQSKSASVFPELVPCKEVASVAGKQRANAAAARVLRRLGASPSILLLGTGLLLCAVALALALLLPGFGQGS